METVRDPKPFCDARQTDEPGALRCDLPEDHDGNRHEETWVATWLRDGTDVQWCINSSVLSAAAPRYRAPVETRA